MSQFDDHGRRFDFVDKAGGERGCHWSSSGELWTSFGRVRWKYADSFSAIVAPLALEFPTNFETGHFDDARLFALPGSRNASLMDAGCFEGVIKNSILRYFENRDVIF